MKNLSPVKPEASNAFTKSDIREWCSYERYRNLRVSFYQLLI